LEGDERSLRKLERVGSNWQNLGGVRMSREEHETVISEVAGRSSKKLKGVGTRAGWS